MERRLNLDTLDADGHAWEVAHNPYWPIRDDGRIDFPAG
jgi:hypothetical protein